MKCFLERGNREALFITDTSVEQWGPLYTCPCCRGKGVLCIIFKSKAICENRDSSWLSTLHCIGCCLHCRDGNNKKVSTISVFIVRHPSSHFSVLTIRGFAIIINGTACWIIHTETVLSAIVNWNPFFLFSPFFFFLLKNSVYMQVRWETAWAAEFGWAGRVRVCCKLVDCRGKRRRNLRPCILMQENITFLLLSVMINCSSEEN